MKSLIVNADDFGLTEGVNRGIWDAHANGIVTSTTLLANGDSFAGAVETARRAKTLAVGAHLNLTQGRPVSPPTTVASLIDGDGKFRYFPGQLCKAILTRQVPLKEVEIELRAQITKILETKITPTHLDGHMHVHIVPGVSGCVVKIAREFGIPAIRCPREEMGSYGLWNSDGCARPPRSAKRIAISLAVSVVARQMQRKLKRIGLRSPAHFYGITETGFLNTRVLAALLQSLPEGVSELCCHPGYWDADLAQTGGELTAQREVEIEALTSREIKTLLETQQIRLATYRELSGIDC